MKSGKFPSRIGCESSRCKSVNGSCLFDGKGLPEPEDINKQSTRTVHAFFVWLQKRLMERQSTKH